MPKIVKQTTRATRSKKESVVDRIEPVVVDEDGLRFNIYGRGKTGKTRLACSFPKPLLLIGTEKGTKSIIGIKGIDFVRLQAAAEIEELAELLKGPKYKSVVLDTAGGLQDLVLKDVLGLDEIPVQKTWGIAKQQDWGTCGVQTKERLRNLLELSETHGRHVVIIAHERNFNDDGAGDELLFPTVGSALSPSIAGWLNGACDYICQTYIREQTVDKETKIGTKTATTQRKTGKKEYCLRVGPHPVYMTGFRLPPGIELPDSIVDPDYNKLIKLINGQK